MNKLVLLVIIVAFIFIVTYDPKKGKPIPELYQPAESELPTSQPICDESRYLELQGLQGTCTGHPKEVGGAIFSA